MTSLSSDDPQPTSRSPRLGHLELLVTLIVMLVIQSFLTTDSAVQRAIFNILFLAVVLSAIRTLSDSRIRLAAAVSVGIVAFVCSLVAETRPSLGMIAATYSLYIVVFSLLVVALAENVFCDGPVDTSRIIGAVNIYFVFGLAWAFVYSLLEIIQPGSFALTNHGPSDGIQHNMVSEFIYFSSVTLTTLGYGDITPVSRPARMFATLEATIGQLYIAIVIARLVGLYISQKR